MLWCGGGVCGWMRVAAALLFECVSCIFSMECLNTPSLHWFILSICEYSVTHPRQPSRDRGRHTAYSHRLYRPLEAKIPRKTPPPTVLLDEKGVLMNLIGVFKTDCVDALTSALESFVALIDASVTSKTLFPITINIKHPMSHFMHGGWAGRESRLHVCLDERLHLVYSVDFFECCSIFFLFVLQMS